MEIKAVIFDMDGLMLDTEKLLVKYWCEAANKLGFPMERRHALALRSFSRKFAIPQLKEWFGEDCDYMAIHDLRVKLMKEYTDVHGIEKSRGLTHCLTILRHTATERRSLPLQILSVRRSTLKDRRL